MLTSKPPRRSLPRVRSTLSGSRRRNSRSLKPRKTRESKKAKISKWSINKTTPESRWTTPTAKCSALAPSLLPRGNPDKKNPETTEPRVERGPITRPSSTTMTSPPSDYQSLNTYR